MSNEEPEEAPAAAVEMETKWSYVRPFLWLLLAHALAIALFTRGFLLTRTELPLHSSCSDVSSSPCSPPSDPPSCWTPPAVDRLVVVVFDALRFDFVAPSSFFGDERKPWMDKLTLPQRLAARFPTSARLFKAFADPPTTSLQRLKGLTTGGLPTFIDIGNSFGAPAIVEDNLIYQLMKNGKKVLMMGDDTWVQLFPGHFEESHPYPSFNVKDLDTVDDGCIEHLIPALYRDDWDVLIAHFLGVDHAGHIFGVDSTPMIQKLEQYNLVLENIVEVLFNHSAPGNIHEGTLLLVMGDHGQTTNGDHGGGTPEEVETSLFAMSLRNPPDIVTSILSTDFCGLNLDGERICISSIQQIDFAATLSALLGIPFPFGSIGRVNPELYALSGGTWQGSSSEMEEPWFKKQSWMQKYLNTLCINCWQVKRYIDLYSATSVVGFSSQDLSHVTREYDNAQTHWLGREHLFKNNSSDESLSAFQGQINAYSKFLENIAALARSKWTEFDLTLMDIGLVLLFIFIIYHVFYIMKVYATLSSISLAGSKYSSSLTAVAVFFVAMRASSFLSNSYILAEGKVANFLLVSAIITSVRSSIVQGDIVSQDVIVLSLTFFFRFRFETIMKQITALTYVEHFVGKSMHRLYLSFLQELLPIIMLSFLAVLVYVGGSNMFSYNEHIIFVKGTLFSYLLIAIHWISESSLIEIPVLIRDMGKVSLPRAIYCLGSGQILLSIYLSFSSMERMLDDLKRMKKATMSVLLSWNSIILILLGRQGSFALLLFLCGAWCMIRLQKQAHNRQGYIGATLVKPMSIMQWNFIAVCLFFYTGHWCAFDGLRYGAAFVGFDQFNLIRQGVLLAIDTFGVSHILPIFGLPLLIVFNHQSGSNRTSHTLYLNLLAGFLIYGCITAVTTTFTVICVRIQRRHLMVWGLFAPKYVFDVIGLVLTDVLIFFASLYYF